MLVSSGSGSQFALVAPPAESEPARESERQPTNPNGQVQELLGL